MSLYRKKPVVIEAIRVRDSAPEEIIEFLGGEQNRNIHFSLSNITKRVQIVTLEGTMTAEPDDWIIKGVKGEYYPCKPDIFAATYEPAERKQP